MTRHFWAILLLLLCCCFAPLRAEEVKVTMKSGSTITGELKELIATDHVTIIIAGVESVIPMTEVSSIENASSSQASTQGDKPSKLVYGQYQITDTKQYPDSFILEIGGQELTMVLVKGGWFNMGFDGRHSLSWHTEPIHRVTLSSFYVSKQLLSRSIVDRLKNKKKPSSKHTPYIFDSRKEIIEIIGLIIELTNAPYRLLTEAEWEYTALMPFAHGIFGEDKRIEWCNDYWGQYTPADQINPTGPSTGNNYVLRFYSSDNAKWKRIKSSDGEYWGLRSVRIAISADQIKQ